MPRLTRQTRIFRLELRKKPQPLLGHFPLDAALGTTVLNRFESAERGFKQSNLKRGNLLIELIELVDAISPKEEIQHYSQKTRMPGLFKVGFMVSDFDTWMTHLKNDTVDFYGNIVTDPASGKRMVILKDPDGNRIQLFEK